MYVQQQRELAPTIAGLRKSVEPRKPVRAISPSHSKPSVPPRGGGFSQSHVISGHYCAAAESGISAANGSIRRERRQGQRGVDQRTGALEIEIAIDVLFHDERGAAVELLVLLMAAAEFRADE